MACLYLCVAARSLSLGSGGFKSAATKTSRSRPVNAIISAVAESWNDYVQIKEVFCTPNSCVDFVYTKLVYLGRKLIALTAVLRLSTNKQINLLLTHS